MIAPDPATSSIALLRRGVAVQRAYCASIGRLTAEYIATMVALGRAAADPATVARAAAPASAPVRAADAAPVLVLEGEAGATATARFLIENHLAEQISAPVSASPFISQDGHTVHVSLQFEPAVVTLQPYEQMLVRVGARIDEELADAGGYRGVLGVPGLPGTELVVLVRLRAAAAHSDLEPSSVAGWTSGGAPAENDQRR